MENLNIIQPTHQQEKPPPRQAPAHAVVGHHKADQFSTRSGPKVPTAEFGRVTPPDGGRTSGVENGVSAVLLTSDISDTTDGGEFSYFLCMFCSRISTWFESARIDFSSFGGSVQQGGSVGSIFRLFGRGGSLGGVPLSGFFLFSPDVGEERSSAGGEAPASVCSDRFFVFSQGEPA